MTAIDRQVREAFIELTDTLASDFDITDFLGRLATRCTELLGVSACGVLLTDPHGQLTLVAATTEEARMLELAQVQNSEGPCLDAFTTGVPVQRGDLGDGDPRWPAFTAAAQAAGFSAVQALPMRLRDERLGALNLLNAVPGPLDGDTVALGQALADAATIGISHQRALAHQVVLTGQLQSALTSRIVIEQAKGILAERFGVSMDAAFGALRRYARDNNRGLADVAADVVQGRLDVARPR